MECDSSRSWPAHSMTTLVCCRRAGGAEEDAGAALGGGQVADGAGAQDAGAAPAAVRPRRHQSQGARQSCTQPAPLLPQATLLHWNGAETVCMHCMHAAGLALQASCMARCVWNGGGNQHADVAAALQKGLCEADGEVSNMCGCWLLLQELMHINVVKGLKDTFGAKTFMGRAAVPIRPYADRPGETVEDWFDLGRGEWSNEDGTVRMSSLFVLCMHRLSHAWHVQLGAPHCWGPCAACCAMVATALHRITGMRGTCTAGPIAAVEGQACWATHFPRVSVIECLRWLPAVICACCACAPACLGACAPACSGRAAWSAEAALEQCVCMYAYAQGKGEGQLQLKLTYFPFELLYSRPRDASLVRPPIIPARIRPRATLHPHACQQATAPPLPGPALHASPVDPASTSGQAGRPPGVQPAARGAHRRRGQAPFGGEICFTSLDCARRARCW